MLAPSPAARPSPFVFFSVFGRASSSTHDDCLLIYLVVVVVVVVVVVLVVTCFGMDQLIDMVSINEAPSPPKTLKVQPRGRQEHAAHP